MLIDFHIHIFPDQIAERTIQKLTTIARSFECQKTITPCTNGTLANTKETLASWGVDFGVFMPVATKPGQGKHINENAALLSKEQGFLSFGSIFPTAKEELFEIDTIKKLGLKGIKMHPDYQQFYADEERVFPVYEKMEELGLILFMHAGQDPLSPDDVHAKPQMIATIASHFPKLKIIAAHMGGISEGECVFSDLYEKHFENVYVDTSMHHCFCDQKTLLRAVKAIGAERVVFGSDCPWSDGKRAVQEVLNLGLSEAENQAIFCENAKRLLEI